MVKGLLRNLVLVIAKKSRQSRCILQLLGSEQARKRKLLRAMTSAKS